jgi:predicted ATPase
MVCRAYSLRGPRRPRDTYTPALQGRVRAERENFRGALEWAAENGDGEAVARLAYPPTFYWWIGQGQLQEAGRWVAVALEHLADSHRG